MTPEQREELEAHAAELERAAEALRLQLSRAKNNFERGSRSAAAAAYEIEAIWLRGFLRREAESHSHSTTAQTARHCRRAARRPDPGLAEE